jgi:cell division initiation protein
MKLTPLDIQQKEFKKSFRGYDQSDVDEFLSKLSREYELLFSENKKLKDQIVKMQEEIKKYIEMERTLREALLSAQKSAQEMKLAAKQQAELIIKEAELNAEKIIEDARLEAKDILREVKELNKRKEMMKLELKAVLDRYYEMLKDEVTFSKEKKKKKVKAT